MAFMFRGLGVILLIHVIAPIFLVVTAVRRRCVHDPVGKLVVSGLCYYILVAAIAFALEGPHELMRDSFVMLEALFCH